MTIIACIASGLLIVSIYINLNLYSKNRLYEQIVNNKDGSEEQYMQFFEYILFELTSTLRKLQRVDRTGAFESDDETGFTFAAIMKLVEQTTQQIQHIKKQLHGSEEHSTETEKEKA